MFSSDMDIEDIIKENNFNEFKKYIKEMYNPKAGRLPFEIIKLIIQYDRSDMLFTCVKEDLIYSQDAIWFVVYYDKVEMLKLLMLRYLPNRERYYNIDQNKNCAKWMKINGLL